MVTRLKSDVKNVGPVTHLSHTQTLFEAGTGEKDVIFVSFFLFFAVQIIILPSSGCCDLQRWRQKLGPGLRLKVSLLF